MQSFLVQLADKSFTLLYVPSRFVPYVVKLTDNSGKLRWSVAFMVAQLPGAYWMIKRNRFNPISNIEVPKGY